MKNMKKILITILCALGVFASAGNARVTGAAESEEKVFGGFYETSAAASVLTVENLPSDTYDATVDGKSVACSVTGDSVTLTNLDALTLGETYVLTLTGESSVQSVEFMYVTKAIKTVEDLSVLDVKTEDTVIDGYYVLADNIDAGYDDVVLKHAGATARKGGFKGTFDGLGHTLTFAVGTSDGSNRRGLFGFLLGGAVIKNTGFVDIFTQNSAVISQYCNATYSERIIVRDCYFSIARGCITGGVILEYSNLWLEVHNVIVDWPDANIDTNTQALETGALYGIDGNRQHESRDKTMSNIYVLSDAPIAFYHETKYDGAMHPDKYYIFYAANDGKTADWDNGVYVYANVLRYKSRADMLAAGNSYTSFQNDCWDLSTGTPVFKEAMANEYAVLVDGVEATAKVYLHTVEKEGYPKTAQISVSFNGIPLENVTPAYEVISGGEFVSVSSTGLATGIAKGTAEVKVSFTVNGETQEHTLKFTVRETPDLGDDTSSSASDTESSENTGGSSAGAGAGSSCRAVGVDMGSLALLSATTLLIKRKK